MSEIELPLPPRQLHPNARACWQAKARLTKKTRAEACFVARMHPDRPLEPFELMTVEPVFYVGRRNDPDNLGAWIKCICDALQDAGWIANDKGLTLLPAVQVVGRERKLVLRIDE